MQVKITGGTLSHEEITAYIKHCTEKYKNRRIDRLEITVDGEDVVLDIYSSLCSSIVYGVSRGIWWVRLTASTMPNVLKLQTE